ncbi:MAG: proprotein convertase P-domain-containing protein [Planctomycetota bacterium]|nr:proprotein convertase P-domain-containing protein [Planctomycetota bacterium]
MNAPLLAAALSLSIAPSALAQDSAAVHSRMLQVASELANARANGAPASVLSGLLAHYAELSERVGGDDPANATWGSGPAPASAPSTLATGPQFQNAPVCSGAGTQTFNFSGTGGVIPSTSVDNFTTQVSGLGAYLWDVNLTTGITHTACQDLDVTLISPSGTVVVITTDNGGINDNVFNGTIWDDSIPDPVTDRIYQNLVTASPLSPEGRLAAFRGEDPNGTWTLRVQDDAFSNAGSVGSWSLQLSALATAPTVSSATFTRSPALPLADNATTFDSLVVSGAGTSIAEVELYLEIRHTSCQDLDIVLISPTGSQAVVTTDGGGSFDNVFRGTLFDVDAPTPVTDVLFTNLTAVPLASPEGGFDAFVGLNPNGSWQLRVTDDNGTEVGTLDRWDLTVRTVPAPTAPPPGGYSGTTGPITDFGPGAPTSFTIPVSGVTGSLWDIDLTTFFVHAACADLDVKLKSPSGREIVVTTDNGFTGGVFNGTLFDDNANDAVTDHFYTTNVLASPLSPEGRLTAFRGDTPNGNWVLTVADDSTAVTGSLTSWSLALSTVPLAPTVNSASFTSSPNVPLPDPGAVVDSITVSGLGTSIAKVRVYAEIPHTWSDDIDVFLTSPSGTKVTVITDCSGNFDDVFNGTTFDPASSLAPSDYPYQDLVVVPLLAPEGSFDNFLGQNPNGTWTLDVRDDFANDTGSFLRWDLFIETCGTSAPTVFCNPVAPGTSSGCLPSLSAPTNPNVQHSGQCLLTLTQVEGAKSGLFFYGVNGSQQLSWCNGVGSSFFCVRPPTQRTSSLVSGGSAGQCNGVFVLDWHAFQLANPGSIGSPFGVGDTVDVQGWFRDPGSCKTTFLSPAVELVYQP